MESGVQGRRVAALTERKDVKEAPTPALEPTTNCAVESTKDGGLIVHFRVSPEEARRLKLRAGPQDLAMHIWENILKRGVSSYVF